MSAFGLGKGEQMYKAQPYLAVNSAWPQNVPIPSEQEALTGAKKLYRKFRGRAWKGKWKLTSGRNHTWPRRGVYAVNPNANHHEGGWKAMVHSMSHFIAHRIYPNAKGHGTSHAFLEKEMIQFVISEGWLESRLKRPEKVVIDLQDVRHTRVLENIARWETKMKRAKTALKKLHRQRAYYERKVA